MLLKAKNCVRCGIKFTTGLDVHAEHKPKNAAAINEYVTWCGDCYPVKHEPFPATVTYTEEDGTELEFPCDKATDAAAKKKK